jgi:hypothetical protein
MEEVQTFSMHSFMEEEEGDKPTVALDSREVMGYGTLLLTQLQLEVRSRKVPTINVLVGLQDKLLPWVLPFL